MAINKDFKVKNGIDVAGNATIGGDITSTGTITASNLVIPGINNGGSSQYPLDLGSAAASNLVLQRWNTSAGIGKTYIVAYGSQHASEAGNFAIKNVVANSDIYFELAGSVEPLRLTSTGATFAGNIVVSGTVDGVDIAARDAVLTSTTTTAGAALPKAGGTMTGPVSFGDNVRAKFGVSNDLVIYHDGTESIIAENGTGDLKISGNNLWLNDVAGNTYFRAVNGSYAKMYHAGSEKLATTSTGVDVTGTVTANTSGDSNGSKGLVINTTGTNFESDAGIIQVTHAGGGSTTGGYFMKMKAGGVDKFTLKGNGDVVAAGAINADAATIEGQLEISSTSPYFKLTDTDVAGFARVLGSSGNLYLDADPTNVNTNSQVQIRIDDELKALFDDSGDVFFYEDTGTTSKFHWDASAESLGIGDTTPSEKLDVNGNIRVPSLAAGGGVTFHNNREFQIAATDDGTYSHDKGLIISTLDYGSYGISMGIHTSGGLTNNLSNFTPQLRIDNTGNVGIGTESPSQKLEVAGNIKHSGLTMTDGTDIDQIKEYNRSLQLTLDWLDTGINSTDLQTGTYIVQIYDVTDHTVAGQHYGETYSGIMSWYSGNSNAAHSDEIVLHRAGLSPNNGRIYLRIKRTYNADTNDVKLQIASDLATTGAYTYAFKFRRMI